MPVFKIGDYVISNLECSGGTVGRIVDYNQVDDYFVVKGFLGGSRSYSNKDCHEYSAIYLRPYRKAENILIKQILNN
jgi:hypothetical protein